MKIIYPGSFDPMTLGHLDILTRASNLFDEVLVVVAQNAEKQYLFTPDERVALIKQSCSTLNNISVHQTDGLIVDFAKQHGTKLILRSARNSHDMEFESQLAFMNRTLSPAIETLLMPCSPEFNNISSSLIKEIVQSGGDASRFLPTPVMQALAQKLRG
ncbi:MAG: pantetheine-phosphate adenylyltransferase [Legionellaceae bacterium]|nr:pantetheine-phosphate adenylyltransferase [Legionellaceae bacterium]